MAIDIVVPVEQEGTQAVVKTWLKRPGDAVRIDEPVVELETDKVSVEIAATANGVLAEILIEEGTEVAPGALLGRIAEGSVQVASKVPSASVAAPPLADVSRAVAAQDASRLPPGIRRLLAEHGLEPADVPIAGDKLTREDIQAEVERRAKAPATGVGVTRVPHDNMRKRIAERLAHSLATAPHVTSVFEADLSAVEAHRAANKQSFASQGANLTFTCYMVAASAAAMQAAPTVNARWYDDRLEIFEDVNVGVGTALGDKGLIVPVIQRAQKLSLLEIAQQLTDLTERARAGKLGQADVRDGTFSISNHGVSGSLVATPIIINPPQSAILGVGKLEKRAVVRNDQIVIRPMAYVSLTIDHRVLDAFQTNAWLTRFVETLESWPR